MFGWARATKSEHVFEVVLAFVETVRQLLDDLESTNACSINEIDLVKDFGIRKVL
jgi:hypothetical protein